MKFLFFAAVEKVGNVSVFLRLRNAQLAHKHTGVLIEGAIGVLALFMLLTAIVNASPLYLAFVGGLILNMRMAALSVGTDFFILGTEIPPDLLFPLRQATLVLYFANTVGLFSVLFKTDVLQPASLPQMMLINFLSAISVI